MNTTTSTSTSTTTTIAPTTTALTLEDLYADVEGGVLRANTLRCDGAIGGGTAFLVGPRHVVTAAHVVADAEIVGVERGSDVVGAIVIGIDPALDVALLELDRRVGQHAFELSDEVPRTGSNVAAIGFPLGEDKTLTRGVVSGVDRTIQYEDGQTVTQLIQTDVSLNFGSSGGPLLNEFGEVVGIAAGGLPGADGINYAATAALARPVIDSWIERGEPVAVVCPTTSVEPDVTVVADPATELALASLDAYFTAINEGRYEDARLRIVPWKRLSSDVWAEGMSSTTNVNITVHTVETVGENVEAWVSFTSLQDGDKGTRPGETCTDWSMDYTLVPADDGLMWIESSVGHAGGPLSAACSGA